MIRIYFSILFIISTISSNSQTASVCPNGDMENVSICFVNGVIFHYWSDGCTDAWVNPTPTANSGNTAMLITNDNSQPAPMSSQDFKLTGPIPGCIEFAAKLDLNAGDTVKVNAYVNCNGGWMLTGNWYYTNSSAVNLSYTNFQFANNNSMLCIIGMDSMRLELIGGKILNGTVPTRFYVDDIFLDCATGIKKHETEGLKIYPNPSVDEITCELPGNKIASAIFTVYNTAGQSVLNGSFTGKIDVTSLPGGLYSVELKCKEQTFRRIFCIQR